MSVLSMMSSLLAETPQTLTRKDVLRLRGKPETIERGKCTGEDPACQLGVPEEIMHYPAIIRLTKGTVYSIDGVQLLSGAPIDASSKKERFVELMNKMSAILNVTVDTITAVRECRAVRKIPIVLMNANQVQLLNACIAAGN
jgi:hypothetical protein